MAIFSAPRSFQYANSLVSRQLVSQSDTGLITSSQLIANGRHSGHPSFFYLVLLVFEAVLEVVCVSLPGYFAARQGMFDTDAQKLVANLNVTLFTPCLIFTKLGSQLTAEKLTDLAIIPLIFIIQTFVSYLCAFVVSKCFRFKKRRSNFVTAMAVFGNSNSLPISLVMSLSQTLKGLHWDRIPNDNDDEVAARGILYLLIFQQLGQLVRWSWGYHVLLAPRERYLEEAEREAGASRIEQGQERYTDNPEQIDPDEPLIRSRSRSRSDLSRRRTSIQTHNDEEFHSGDQTPVGSYSYSKTSGNDSNHDQGRLGDEEHPDHFPPLIAQPPQGPFLPRQNTEGNMLSFPNVELAHGETPQRGCLQQFRASLRRVGKGITQAWEKQAGAAFRKLPTGLQKGLFGVWNGFRKFVHGAWDFMNPPLWAMLVSIVVASVPSLQKLFFDDGSFVNNSVTRAVNQNGQVAVPLILVVLGANLARNTLPEEALKDLDHPKEERNLIIASLIARMLLPTIIMAPLLALLAKYVPVSILDDPIFIIVCFLLTGAPSALQLAQICQINNVYVSAMSNLLFQSYVVWILPSTLVLVMCAMEVVEWASATT
ncbi:hypothetical protein SI65_08280 [Aspergillus cristatus]|uniref:Transporter n=1 Tax=Aspergillus cristatus TaxID=573508 RepID=A0A1E3B651_ASPCR|nr:hypothetical protein SI65_08280 [Aspergillus cristatus]